MRFYTVHERPGSNAGVQAGAADILLIRSAFSWSAALLTPVWLIWHRLWLGLLLYLLVMVPLGVFLEMIEIADPADLAIGGAIAFLMGCSAADFRRWTLQRRGWRLAAVVAAVDEMEAELRYRRDAADSHYYAPPAASAATTTTTPMGGSLSALPRLI